MSFDRRRHESIPADRPIPNSQRRTFLDVLRLDLMQRHQIASEVLRRDGRLVLFTVVFLPKARTVEIGCEMRDGRWWFTWATDDDRTIAPVEDTSGTADVIADVLGVSARNGRPAGRS